MCIGETKHSCPIYSIDPTKTVSIFLGKSFPKIFYFRWFGPIEPHVLGVVISTEDGGLIINK